MLKDEIKYIKVNKIYDISKPLKESNDNYFSNFHGSQKLKEMSPIKDKWITLMTIGKYLVDNPKLLKQIPKKVRNEIQRILQMSKLAFVFLSFKKDQKKIKKEL